jgi:hypothetical protein
MTARTKWVDKSVVEGIYAPIFDAEDMHILSGEFITPASSAPPRALIIRVQRNNAMQKLHKQSPSHRSNQNAQTWRENCVRISCTIQH